MFRYARILSALALVTLLPALATPASAQVRTITLQVVAGNQARVFLADGTLIAYTQFAFSDQAYVVSVPDGTSVRLAAVYPGSFSGGTGPAAGCALSTCSFTLSGNAEVNVAGSGAAFATVTTTVAGSGSGAVWADGVACQFGSCKVKYLVGSSVQLTAQPYVTARFTSYASGTGAASACGASATCTFTLSGDASVTANFLALTSFTVTPASAMSLPGGPATTFTATGTYSNGSTAVMAPAVGAWATAPSLPVATENLAATSLGGVIYAVGGDTISFDASTTSAMAAFDPATQTWTNLTGMLVRRQELAATTAGGLLYAIGGAYTTSGSNARTPLASMERYDPAMDTWTMRAPMPAPRRDLVAGTINGIVYAAGGVGAAGTPVGTLEAYDPASDTWTPRAPMPTPRSYAAAGVIDGILYVAGGSNGASSLTTLEAYDPATDTWSSRAPMPMPLAGPGAVADGVLYVVYYGTTLAYDPVADTWRVKAPMISARFSLAAAALNGTVYAIGGQIYFPFCCNKARPIVETFVDALRWSSSAPLVARIDQTGRVTPLAAGTAAIIATVGGLTCGGSCPTFTVVGPSQISLDVPANHSVISAGSTFTIGGWAINRAASSGTGVDAVHVYVQPSGGPAAFLAVAPYGVARADIGALYGAQFTNSGFLLQNQSLPAGSYTILAYAHDAITGAFDAAASASITVTAPVSNGMINVDSPTPGQVVTSAFEVGGWAIDRGAPSGSGVDGIQFYVQPAGSPAPGVFIGTGSVGDSRPDVGAAFGSQFTNSGFHFTITGLGPGSYTLGVYAHSTVTGSFSIVKTLPFSVNANQLMSIDLPSPEATITGTAFSVAGWSIDRTAAGASDTGVDTLHVYAYPNPGSGTPPIFLGVAAYGIARSDVGAAYGSQYTNSGYQLDVNTTVSGLAPGVYNIVVHSHSTSGAFNNLAVVRVTLQ